MDETKPNNQWGARLFLAIIFSLGGIISILVPASSLDRNSIGMIILGITLVMQGACFFMESMEGIRKERKQNKEAKGTKD